MIATLIQQVGAEAADHDAAMSPEPFCFRSSDHQLFGWLHKADPHIASGWGLVVCNPFGYEAHCGHRSIRAFADAAAALGIPALRFDYLGTGDSADIDRAADQIEAWSGDIAHAVAELKRRTAVERVCLLGFRLGALLATRAADQCEVDALAFVAPVLSGRNYLKEARALQMAAAAAEAAASGQETLPGRTDPDPVPALTELSGHLLSAASIASLRKLEGQARRMSNVSAALLIDRTDLPAARQWAQALEAASVRVEYHALPGFVEMMMTSPQFAAVPDRMLETTRRWLSSLITAAPLPRPTRQPERSQNVAATAARHLTLTGEDGSPALALTERPVFITPDGTLFGIITEPRRDELRRRAVILPNNGAEYHVGSCRLNVSLARRWARRGYHVLRMDLGGLGDSRTRPGCRENDVFPRDALEDIRSAIEFLRGHYGISDITLAGLCSGAYHSLRAAAAGMPINRLLMVNVENYFWDSSMKLDELRLAEVVRNPTLYRERIASVAAWKRFLTGRMNVWNVVRVYLHLPLLPIKSRLRDLARRAGIRLRNDLGRELQEMISRGTRVVFIFARGEPGIKLLHFEAGSTLKHLGEHFRILIIDGADHTFSRNGPRSRLEDVLTEELLTKTA